MDDNSRELPAFLHHHSISKTSGFIYAASHEMFPGILKLGMTAHAPERRMKTLGGAVPSSVPWVLEYFTMVSNRFKAERYVFRRLATCRVSQNKEFFRIPVKHAKAVMDLAEEECHQPITEREVAMALYRAKF